MTATPSQSQFSFLRQAFPALYSSALQAEITVKSEIDTSATKARRTLEIMLDWLFENDPALAILNLSDLGIYEKLQVPELKKIMPYGPHGSAELIRLVGNRATHGKKITPNEALSVIRALFDLSYWFSRTYAPEGEKVAVDIKFHPEQLPETSRYRIEDIKKLQVLARNAQHEAKKALAYQDALRKARQAHAEAQSKSAEEQQKIAAENKELLEKLETLRKKVAERRHEAEKQPDQHDYNEAETRKYLIDGLLEESGWDLSAHPQNISQEYRIPETNDRADYVLWGDDGKPLAIIEAKRTKLSPKAGLEQAKLKYADPLEKSFGQRPLIFSTNGYRHFLWEDQDSAPREVAGFFTKQELQWRHQKLRDAKKILQIPVDNKIASRPYQLHAIGAASEAFDGKKRAALLVMATGTGKTRTTIALVDRMLKAGVLRRVLFLADRSALVKQARNAFRAHLSAPTARLDQAVGKENDPLGALIHFSTYQTMIHEVGKVKPDGTRLYGAGMYDLIITDEAHRSIYNRYAALFDWFDALLLGLTATPRGEISHDTFKRFNLERGVPTFAYELSQAVADNFLVPPKIISIQTEFMRKGIHYERLSEADQAQWQALAEKGQLPLAISEENSEDNRPDIDPSALTRWLFNKDTVQKMLAKLLDPNDPHRGLRVEDNDKLGKTIIFARNHNHAEFIENCFNETYPHLKGNFARVIDNQERMAENLIDSFSQADQMPQIAISVDMLDTGIDVPEIVNLVFFKPIGSRTKFWQMVGRGTRLCPDLHGKGQDKTEFRIFDYCANAEYFQEEIEKPDSGKMPRSLFHHLFTHRTILIERLQGRSEAPEIQTKKSLIRMIQSLLKGMHYGNILIRPHWEMIEHFQKEDSWKNLSSEDLENLDKLGAFSSQSAYQEAKSSPAAYRFDLLMLRGQLAFIEEKLKEFNFFQDNLISLAGQLEEEADHLSLLKPILPLLRGIQEESWWAEVSIWDLERVRQDLRPFIIYLPDSPQRQQIVETDFNDTVDEISDIDIKSLRPIIDQKMFQQQARQFLQKHLDDPALLKLRQNKILSENDLIRLADILKEEGNLEDSLLETMLQGTGLAKFIRKIVGLNREVVQKEFESFLHHHNFNPRQMRFIDFIIEEIAKNGEMETGRFYETPFIHLDDNGLEGMFPEESDRKELEKILARIGQSV